MKTKNKLIIAFSALGVITLGGIIALIAVIASFNANVDTGGFNISYTAYDLDASVTASYYVGPDMTSEEFYNSIYASGDGSLFTTIQTSDGKSVMEFLGEDGKSETKDFSNTEISIGRKEAFYVKYTITNYSIRTNCVITGLCNFGENNKNASVYHYYYEPNGAPVDPWVEITAADPSLLTYLGSSLVIDYEGEYVDGLPVVLYYKIVATNPTKDMNFDGSFDFTLVGDPE